MTGCLKQVVAFDLKCLFPDSSHDPLAAFDDGVSSEVQGDSEKSQSQDDGQSDEEWRSVLCVAVVAFLVREFAFVMQWCNCSFLWQLSVCFD